MIIYNYYYIEKSVNKGLWMANLKCSILECKKRKSDVKNMSFSELEKYNTKCCNCGDWILKDEQVANETYHAVSTTWAEKFMNKVMGK